MRNHGADTCFAETVDLNSLFFIRQQVPALHDIEQQKIRSIVKIIIGTAVGPGSVVSEKHVPVIGFIIYPSNNMNPLIISKKKFCVIEVDLESQLFLFVENVSETVIILRNR